MARGPHREPNSIEQHGIVEVSVKGFKSHFDEHKLEIRPLTILSGANSSGKSSIMQPLLLMKQTLEVTYDPGPLLMDGPNVRFTSADQLISSSQRANFHRGFAIKIEVPKDIVHTTSFSAIEEGEIAIDHVTTTFVIDDGPSRSLRLTPHDDSTQLAKQLAQFLPEEVKELYSPPRDFRLAVRRERCSLTICFESIEDGRQFPARPTPSVFALSSVIRMIHVPGLRGNPARSYERTATGPTYPGTFEKYVATVVADWESKGDIRLAQLESMLTKLGLTRRISAKRTTSTQIELQVGRLSTEDKSDQDLVNIADVGFGVSQVLPVLVATLVAENEQLVYIEQPELHLHPRAQYRLAEVLASAADRGVRLIIETHSALLLLQVRTLIASGRLDPVNVRLHWFARDTESGATSISSVVLDENGAFGDWPEDFGAVELRAESGYLDAVERRNAG